MSTDTSAETMPDASHTAPEEVAPARLTVIIPAYNEAAVIGACVASVRDSTAADRVEVVVATNGCTDDTAAVARRTWPQVRVVDSPIAAKHAALNLGDEVATAPHRVYLDADTTVSPGALDAVADLLDQPGVWAASPAIRFDVRSCSWPARQFHRVWRQTPYYQRTTLGAGFYALSAEGRRQFDRFPPVVGDDYFVSNLVPPERRRTATGHTFTPLLPTTVRSMLRVHVRHYGAHAQFDRWWAEHGAAPLPGEPDDGYGWLLGVARAPANWPGIALYVGVKLLARPLGRLENRRTQMGQWTRDEGGRRATST